MADDSADLVAPTAFETLLFAAGSGRRAPPVDRWNPPSCGAIDIRIAADGTWYHEGGAISRTRLARLFSSLLRKDDDGVTYLVTPHEKLAITVDDAPLVVVDHAVQPKPEGPELALRTSMGDVVTVGPDHPVRFAFEESSDGVKPYVLVRGRLEALIDRSTTFAILNDDELIDWDGDVPALLSGPSRFPIVPQ
ncbi:MAG: DUF1285 domain-containing protein [Devosiaceae bacterium]|nr:DUF1285 domain-containing protein [Devosiaceae bacterium MH13]